MWPDWTGETVAIIASGPTAKTTDLRPLHGKSKVIAIKENVDLCPWADVVYGCDAAWWIHRRGLPQFKGLKITWAGSKCDYPDLLRVEIDPHSNDLVAETGRVGSGANSGFQAFNLAIQWGAAKIILVGFDMHERGGAHWYGRNIWQGANNPTGENFRRWRRAFEKAAPIVKSMGIDVINVSPFSELSCFRRSTIGQALSEKQLEPV